MCKFGFIFVKHLRPVDSQVYWSSVVIIGHQWSSVVSGWAGDVCRLQETFSDDQREAGRIPRTVDCELTRDLGTAAAHALW